MMFSFAELLDLPLHLGAGPGLYILDQKMKGLVPRGLLRDPEAAVAALDNLFRDTSEEPNVLLVKAEQAYGIIATRKMVDGEV
jgi:hypothetical protein